MLSRAMAPVARTALAMRTAAPVASTLDSQTRGMAINLAALKKRIKATANVAKLTGVMKLVASSKLKSVEEGLAVGRPFGEALRAAVTVPEEEAGRTAEEQGVKNIMVVIVTTDRGLCGGVNSMVSRFSRTRLAALAAAGHNVTAFALGDKARVQIGKESPELMVGVVDQCLDKDPIFPLAAEIANRIVTQKFDSICFIHNKFENAAKYSTITSWMPSMAGFDVGVLPTKLSGYDVEPENNEEALINMMEYSVGGLVYSILLESQACEVSQRIIAMDNASTNAGEMVDRFTLLYNRARQSKITTELTEIVAGAEALVDDTLDD